MSSSIPSVLRQLVIKRAVDTCEYCQLPQSMTLHKHEPDHIVPIQHGGETTAENLSLSCMRCNRFKGPNVGSFDPQTGQLVAFFNPRKHNWREHFKLAGPYIQPLTAEGRVTAKILRFNDNDRVDEREELIEIGMYDHLKNLS